MKKQYWILGVGLSLISAIIPLQIRIAREEGISWGLSAHVLLYSFLYSMMCWMLHVWLMNHRPLSHGHSSRSWYSALYILFVAGMSFPFDYAYSFLNNNLMHLPFIAGRGRFFSLCLRGILESSLFFFVIRHLHLLEEKQQHRIEIEQLKQAQLAANLSSLKEQLSPHFLFNTLNTLSSITQEQPVKDYVDQVANVYRYALMYHKADTATLQQELNFISSYLFILKTRLEDALDVKIDVDDSLYYSKIPPLTLQLLIENAIKHNVASASRQLRIHIYNEDRQYLVVSNNLQAKSSTQFSTGIGLSNVMQRFQLLFNRDIIIQRTGDSFSVKLPIIVP